MIEVFKTDVQQNFEAEQLKQVLLLHFACIKVSFDLDDCDRILRIQGEAFDTTKIIELTKASGFSCKVLDD